MNFNERKRIRSERFNKYVFGWKQRNCTACSGSGRYDDNGSPRCSACNGTGKEKYRDESLQVGDSTVQSKKTN